MTVEKVTVYMEVCNTKEHLFQQNKSHLTYLYLKQNKTNHSSLIHCTRNMVGIGICFNFSPQYS